MQPASRDKDAALAGLCISFAPVELRPRAPPGARPASAEGRRGQEAAGGASKAVSFNLRQRRPGPAYSSPQLPPLPGVPARPRSAEGAAAQPAAQAGLRRSWPSLRGGPSDVDSAVQLLQALKQRGPAPAEQAAAARIAGLARLKEAALARRKASAAEMPLAQQRQQRQGVGSCEPSSPTESSMQSPAAEPAGLGEEDAELLHHAEQLLAGCAVGAAGAPAPLSSPRHMQLVSIPTRGGEDDYELQGWDLHPSGASPPRPILRPADVLPPAGGRGEGSGGLIAAVHSPVGPSAAGKRALQPASPRGGAPDPASIHCVHAILSTITYPTSPAGRAPAGSTPAAAPAALEEGAVPAVGLGIQGSGEQQCGRAGAAGVVDFSAAPRTLQEALLLLGLAPPDDENEAEVAVASHSRTAHLAPLWAKLRAAEVVLHAKHEAARQEMRPLLARLRHIRANLEFHKVGPVLSPSLR